MVIKDAAVETCKFIREAFSENNTGSASRILAGMVVLSTIFWITYLVLRNHTMPDLAGPSLFIGSGTAATYGINQAKSVVGALKGNGNGDPH